MSRRVSRGGGIGAVLLTAFALAGCGGLTPQTPPGQAIGVSVSPRAASLTPGGTQQFTVSVTDRAHTGVVWIVLEPGGGTIDANGLYTAPDTAGTYHVVCTSQVDPSRSDTATVTVSATPTVAVSVDPTTASLLPSGTQQFTATVTGSANTAVTWSVQEAGGGSVDANGLYTAPATDGTFHVVATSQADNSKSATATVMVSTVPVVAVSVNPTSASLATGGTQQITATVTGSANTAVTWSVQEAGGGSVDANGLYTAPATAGTYHVIATSQADNTKSATATVTVTANPVVAVSVDPTSANLTTGGTQQFTATVTGSANTAVTWSVQEAGGGSVGASGLYTAPATAGTYHVIATSQADGTKTASATVTVTAPPVVAVTVSPTTKTLAGNGTQQFTATVTGTANTAVTWSVQEGAAGGSVDANGLYTAPATAGTYHVVATSVADNTKSASATVTVPTGDVGFTIN